MTNRIAKPQTHTPNVFDREAANLRKAAKELQSDANTMVKEAAKDVNAAGGHANAAGAHLAGAAANALFATGALVKGSLDVMEAGGHAGAAAGYAVAGAAGWSLEGIASTIRFAFKNVARGFAEMANHLTNLLKDGKFTTVRELEGDPKAVRFSEKMFGKSAAELNKSAQFMNSAWNSYVQSVTHLAGAGANVTLAAAHTVAVAGHMAKAAAEVGVAGVAQLAKMGVQAAELAVRMAEKGVEGARDACILAAKISAATANSVAIAGQGQVKVDVSEEIASFQAQLKALQAAA
jgi:hypothetical protein